MKNIYILTILINEEKPYNKFNHLIIKHIEDKLDWLDVIKEEFPKVTIRATEDELSIFIELLREDGFEVQVENHQI